MSTLFDRRVRVTIAYPVPGSYSKTQPNAVVIEGLRVQFTVERSLEKDPNTAKVEITNMRVRPELQVKGVKVFLEAGYADQMAGLFIGDLRNAPQRIMRGADWVTRLELGDGERAYRHARVSRSYAPGTKLPTVVKDLAARMGLDASQIDKAAASMKGEYVGGHVAHGRVADELDKALRGAGYTWSIQDGKLQALKLDEAAPDEVADLGSDSGLVGSPEWSTPSKKGERPVLHVRALLTPRCRPGARVKIRSTNASGVYKIKKVTHKGDTAGADWYTELECEAL